MTEPLSKIDSAVQGIDSPTDKKETAAAKRRQSSAAAPGVYNLLDLQEEETVIELPIETQQTGWKINESSSKVEDPAILKLLLTKPPVKKIDLRFPTGIEITARNRNGVTIKDALDAIHKKYRGKDGDELPEPYLQGFIYDTDESWTRLEVKLGSTATSAMTGGGGGKKKKGKKDKEEE